MTMTDIADSKQRSAALKPEHSYIVRAPAGSGKTELLIRRYLRLLSGVESPEEIIAITFTRKAAAEMRGRIIAALDLARSNAAPEDTYKKETYQLAADVLKQDELHHWQLQDNPGRLRILTIDALCSTITRQMPVLSRLGAQPETLDDASELYLQAAERTIMTLEDFDDDQTESNWSDAVAELLQHLDNDLPRLKQLLADMLSRRDQWLRHVTNGNISREALDQALHNIVTAALNRIQKAFINSNDFAEDELIELLHYAANNLIQEGSTSLINACAHLETLPAADPAALSQWHGLAELFLTQKNEWRKSVNKNTGFPAGDNKAEKEQCKAYKDRFTQLLASYAENDSLLEALTDIRYLPEIWAAADTEQSLWINDSQWRIIQVLPTLLVVAAAQLRVLFSERSKIDFTGIQQSALQALGDTEQPSDLALQLDYRIQHILVDEFQDVSVSQYELLEKLTEGWSENDGRSLFLVGDPMQSIYRFREAEVGKFLSTFTHHHLGHVRLQSLTLEVNFRSQENVVAWVNDTFARILPAQEDIANSAVSYSPVIAADTSATGKIVVHPLLQNDQDAGQQDTEQKKLDQKEIGQQEAEQISQLILELQNDKPDKSIAILVRNRTHLSAIIEHLKQNGIRFQAVEIERLSHRAAIQDCMALTRALLHPADRIAWLSILRAPWCGLTLADLHQLTGSNTNQYHRAAVWTVMNDDTKVNTLSDDGQKRLINIRDIFFRALANRRRKPLRRLVEMVWMECGGPATLEDDSDLNNIQTFFGVLQQAEESGDLKTLTGLENAVDKLYAAADVQTMEDGSDNKVQIMTIHKSKGLEFDVVILPGLGRGSRSEEKRLLLWQEQQREEGGTDLLLAPIKETGNEDDSLYRYLEILEKTKLKNEEGRLLYVATTRAKEQLHLFGSTRLNEEKRVMNPPRKDSLLAKLWPVVAPVYEDAYTAWSDTSNSGDANSNASMGDQQVSVAKHSPPAMRVNQIKRHATNWTRPAPPENVVWREREISMTDNAETDIEFEWASETIRYVGIVVHQCIQLMSEQGSDQDVWNEEKIHSKRAWFRQALKRQGVGDEVIHTASQQVEEALTNMIKDERGQWLLSPEHQQAKNEYAMTGLYQDEVISIKIDRTFVDKEGTRWIIDYKTSRHEESDVDEFLNQQQQRYRQQLERYGALMQQYEGNPVKLGLYFPLLQGWREWEYNV